MQCCICGPQQGTVLHTASIELEGKSGLYFPISDAMSSLVPDSMEMRGEKPRSRFAAAIENQ